MLEIIYSLTNPNDYASSYNGSKIDKTALCAVFAKELFVT